MKNIYSQKSVRIAINWRNFILIPSLIIIFMMAIDIDSKSQAITGDDLCSSTPGTTDIGVSPLIVNQWYSLYLVDLSTGQYDLQASKKAQNVNPYSFGSYSDPGRYVSFETATSPSSSFSTPPPGYTYLGDVYIYNEPAVQTLDFGGTYTEETVDIGVYCGTSGTLTISTEGIPTNYGTEWTVEYQLYDATNNPIGLAQNGNGATITWNSIAAGTYHVDATRGSDTGGDCDAVAMTGTLQIAIGTVKNIDDNLCYLGINEAIDAATTADGETIEVYDGTYTENVVIDKDLTIKAVKTTNPVDINGSVEITADGVTLRDFDGILSVGAYAIKIAAGADNYLIDNIDIVNSLTDGILIKATAGGGTIQGNVISLNITGINIEGALTGVLYIKSNTLEGNDLAIDNNADATEITNLNIIKDSGILNTGDNVKINGNIFDNLLSGGTAIDNTGTGVTANLNSFGGFDMARTAITTTQSLNALSNWYGSVKGPTVAANPCGDGWAVSTLVDYNPWYKEAAMSNLVYQLVAFNVSGDATVCPGASATVTLSGSQNVVAGADYKYTLYKENVLVPASAKPGTGAALTWSVSDPDCDESYTYTVKAENLLNDCVLDMTDEAVVTFQDITDPVISGCPADVEVTASNGECEATATWTEPTASDNCTDDLDIVWTSSADPGDVFPLGITVVTYDAEDECGNTSTCTFNVTVLAAGVFNVTQDEFYCTIQDAIDDANTLDFIEVYDGTYTEDVDVWKDLTITAVSTTDPVEIAGSVEITADGVTLQDFDGIISGDDFAISIAADADNYLIDNNQLVNSLTDGIFIEDGAGGGTIRGNVISVNTTGINIDGTLTGVLFIKDNLLENNITADIVNNANNVEITDGNIFNNSPLGIQNSGDAVVIDGNTFDNIPDGGTAIENSGTGVTVNKNSFGGTLFSKTAITTTQPLDVRSNWYGSVKGPTVAANPCGDGWTVSTLVDYNPWYSDETMTTLVYQLEAYTVSGPLTPVCPNTNFDVVLANSQTNVNYSLYETVGLATTLVSTQPGTNSVPLTWTISKNTCGTTYTYTIEAINTLSLCELDMIGDPDVTVEDITAPTWTTLDNALDRTVDCDDGGALADAQALVPVASDNCDVTLTPFKTAGAFSVGSCPQAGTYTNTWTVSDDCSNEILAVYTQVITVQDIDKPTWTTAAGNLDRLVDCDDSDALTAAQALAPSATDNCDVTLIPVKTAGVFSVGACPQAGTYTNTWTVSDDCGNAVLAVYTQVITVQDIDKPIWTTVAGNLDRTVDCDDDGGLAAAQALAPSATDNCDVLLTPVKTAGSFAVGSCPQAGTYTNTWTVSDDCGNAVLAVYTQTITVTDNIAPQVFGCPGNQTVTAANGACTAVVTWTAPTATDNCTATGNITIVPNYLSGYAFPIGTTTVIYTVTDDCDNQNTTCTFDVTVNTTGVKNVTRNKSYCTIQLAINDGTTLAGDFIEVYDGTYTENVVVNKDLTITAVSPVGFVDIDGSVEITADGVTLQGFDGILSGGSFAIKVTSPAANYLIQNNMLVNSLTDGILVEGGAGGGTIQGNVISVNMTGIKITGDLTGILYIKGNTLEDNSTGINNNADNAEITDLNIFTNSPAGILNTGNNVKINGNNFDNTPTGGIAINNTGTGVSADKNSFGGDFSALPKTAITSTTAFNAESNWYGSAKGPTVDANPCGDGWVVSAGVDYNPWYSDETMTTLVYQLEAFNITASGPTYCPDSFFDVFLDDSQVSVNYELFENGSTTGLIKPGTGIGLEWADLSRSTCGTTYTYTVKATNTLNGCQLDMLPLIGVNVRVEDVDPPVLAGTLPGDAVGNVCQSGAPAAPATSVIEALYTDNCSSAIATLISTLPGGNDCSWSMVYTYTVEDECGNLAANAVVTYTGGDTEAPVVTNSGTDLTVYNERIGNACTTPQVPNFTSVVTATDNCTSPVTDITQLPLAGSVADFGNTTVTISVKDACGNTTTFTKTLTVYDGPVTTAPDDLVVCEGASVEVPITVTSFNKVWAISLVLHYDASKMTYNPAFINNSGLFGPGSVINDVSAYPDGKITIGAFPSGATLPVGTLLTLKFDNVTGNSPLTWDMTNKEYCEYAFSKTNAPFPTYVYCDIDNADYYKNGLVTMSIITADAGLGGTIGECATETFQIDAVTFGTGLEYLWTGTGAVYLSSTTIEDPIFGPAPDGTYTCTLTVTDDYGCTATDFVVIVVDPAPLADAGVGTSLGECAGQTYLIAATTSGTGLAYSWTGTGATYLDDPTIEDPTFGPAPDGTYTCTLTVTDDYGCTATDFLTIIVDPAPLADAGAGTSLGECAGQTYLIAATTSGTGLAYSWTGTGATYLDDPTIEDPTFGPAPDGTYTCTLTVTDDYGCTATDFLTIIVDPAPLADAGAGTSLGECAGQTYLIAATTSGTGLAYSWTGTGATYLDDPTIEDPTFGPAPDGTYTCTLTVTDDYGCTATDFLTIIVDPAPLADAGAGTSLGECAGQTYLIAATTSGTGLAYSWTGTGATYLDDPTIEDPTFGPAPDGTYTCTLTVTDDYGCTATDFLTIIVDPAPLADAGAGTSLGECAGQTYLIAATTSGTGLAYSWTGTGATYLDDPTIEDPTFGPAPDGTYTCTLTVTDDYGCTATDFLTIIVDPAPLADAGTGTSLGECAGQTYLIAATTSGTGLAYSWTGTGATYLDDPTIEDPTFGPAPDGTYTCTLTVTDDYGCTATDFLTIIVDPAPLADAGAGTSLGECAGQTYLIAATTSGTGLAYSWTGTGATYLDDPTIEDPTFGPAPDGTYTCTLTVTDDYGCTATDFLTIIVDPAPLADAGAGTSLGECAGQTYLIAATTSGTGLAYSWTGTGATYLDDPTIEDPTFGPAPDGTYTCTLTVTDDYGCTATDFLTIIVDPAPLADAGAGTSLGECAGQTYLIAATTSGTGLAYSWTGTGATYLDDPTIEDPTFGPAPDGTYTCTLTVTDDYGCTATDFLTIIVDPAPLADAGAGTSLGECAGQTYLIAATTSGTGLAYSWTGTGATYLDDPTIEDPTFGPAPDGTYTCTLTVTDDYGCTATDFLTIIVDPAPLADAGAGTSLGECAGQTYLIAATTSGTGLAYSWTGTGATYLDDPTIEDPTFGPAPDGTYTCTLTVTDDYGCTATDFLTIIVDPAPLADAGAGTSLGECAGQTYLIAATTSGTGLAYSWTGTGATYLDDPTIEDPTFGPAPDGTYTCTLTVTDDYGCTATDFLTIIVDPAPLADAGAGTSLGECAGQTYLIAATTSGTGLAYSWTGTGATYLDDPTIEDPTFGPAPDGTYTCTLTVTDDYGCTATDFLTIIVDPAPLADAGAGTSLGECAGQTYLIAATTSGTGLAYSWTGTGATYLDDPTIEDPTFGPAPDGTYTCTLTVTDDYGCTATDFLTIIVDPAPLADAGAGTSLGECAGQTYLIAATTSGTGLAYSWTGTGATYLDDPTIEDPTFGPAPDGTYTCTLTVTDDYGCTATDFLTIIVDPAPLADAGAGTSLGECAGQTYLIAATTSGTGLAYSWTGTGATYLDDPTIEDPTFGPAPDGTYTCTLTVTDDYGCTATDFLTIIVDPAPLADAGAGTSLGECAGQTYLIAATTSGTGLAYSWTGTGATYLDDPTIEDPTFGPAPDGTYTCTLTVTDDYGCTATDFLTIIVDPAPLADAGAGTSLGECAGQTYLIAATTSGTGLAYSWTGTGATYLDDPTIEDPTFGPAPDGTYTCTLTVTDDYGCTATDFLTIIVDPAPLADAGAGTSLGECAGQTYLIAATTSGTGLAYSWTGTGATYLDDPTIEDPTFGPAPDGTYTCTLTVTDDYGCTATDFLTIIVDPAPLADAGAGTSLGECAGQTYLIAATTSGTGLAYSWTGTGATYLDDPTIEDPTFGPAPDGTYTCTLTVTDDYGCTATDFLTIIVDPAPTADAGSGGTACVVTAFNIDATTTGTSLGYLWTGAGAIYLSSTAIEDPIFSGAPAGTWVLTLTVTDAYGCTATDDVTFILNPIATVSGTILYNNSAGDLPMTGLTVKLKIGGIQYGSTGTTIAGGSYTITGVCPGTYDLEVTGLPPAGGVNSTDAGQVNGWFVSAPKPLIQKVRFYAGDVATLTPGIPDYLIFPNDAGRILQYFVQSGSPTWELRGLWTFWQPGTTNANPTPGTLIPTVTVAPGTTAQTENFYALCTGDFNRGYDPSNPKSGNQNLQLNYALTREAESGYDIELPVYAGAAMEVGAVSLVLEFPSDKIDITDVYMSSDQDSPLMYAVIGDELRIGWHSLDNPLSLNAGEKLLTLKVRVTGTLAKDDIIRFSLANNDLSELADGRYEVISGAELFIDLLYAATGINEPVPDQFVFVNYPNPFIGITTFAYALPVDGRVNLFINDMTGRRVKMLVDEVQAAGEYTRTVDASGMLMPGVYTATLRITTDEKIMTRTIKIIRNHE